MKKMIKQKLWLLTAEHTQALLEGTWGRSQERDRQILHVLLHTGLKIDEFIRLNVGAVYTGKKVKDHVYIHSSSSKSGRWIPLNEEARAAIGNMLTFNRQQGFSLSPSEPLVVSRQRNRQEGNHRLTARQVQRIVKTLREDAALGIKTTPQTFRYTYAEAVLAQGENLETLQKLLGHRSIKTTRALYGKLSLPRKKARHPTWSPNFVRE